MPGRIRVRLDDILDAITQIEILTAGRNVQDLMQDRVACAAFERFVEIISEASRHIPAGLKEAHRGIAWRRIADIGNHLRHGYDRTDLAILWNLIGNGDLDALKRAVIAIKGRL